MKVVITGTDGAGRSYVHAVEERTGLPTTEGLHALFDGPLTVPEIARSGSFGEITPPAGSARVRIFDFAPGLAFAMHYTRSIDFDVVVSGSITLGLDIGSVRLEAGDAVLLRGDSHSWTAGAEGCRMLFALVGASVP